MNNFRTNQISIPEIPRDEDFENDYLLFKVNTTGLPRKYNAPAGDVNNWPRVVQLAWIVIDKRGNSIESTDFIIKPEGYTIPYNAAKIHGISNQIALDNGVYLQSVLNIFNDLLYTTKHAVAYNLSFDEKVLTAEYIRKNITTTLPYKKKISLMSVATDLCQIQGPYGFKFPRLSELYQKLFQQPYSITNDALMDLKATEKCFREMQRRNLI